MKLDTLFTDFLKYRGKKDLTGTKFLSRRGVLYNRSNRYNTLLCNVDRISGDEPLEKEQWYAPIAMFLDDNTVVTFGNSDNGARGWRSLHQSKDRQSFARLLRMADLQVEVPLTHLNLPYHPAPFKRGRQGVYPKPGVFLDAYAKEISSPETITKAFHFAVTDYAALYTKRYADARSSLISIGQHKFTDEWKTLLEQSRVSLNDEATSLKSFIQYFGAFYSEAKHVSAFIGNLSAMARNVEFDMVVPILGKNTTAKIGRVSWISGERALDSFGQTSHGQLTASLKFHKCHSIQDIVLRFDEFRDVLTNSCNWKLTDMADIPFAVGQLGALSCFRDFARTEVLSSTVNVVDE